MCIIHVKVSPFLQWNANRWIMWWPLLITLSNMFFKLNPQFPVFVGSNSNSGDRIFTIFVGSIPDEHHFTVTHFLTQTALHMFPSLSLQWYYINWYQLCLSTGRFLLGTLAQHFADSSQYALVDLGRPELYDCGGLGLCSFGFSGTCEPRGQLQRLHDRDRWSRERNGARLATWWRPGEATWWRPGDVHREDVTGSRKDAVQYPNDDKTAEPPMNWK